MVRLASPGTTSVDRRSVLQFALGAWVPLVSLAQVPGRVYRLGLLHPGTMPAPGDAAALDWILGPLRALGYVEGQNLIVARRYAGDQIDRLPAFARELVELEVDAIFAVSSASIQAAMSATTKVPIVFLSNGDPVAAGLVPSLAKTGSNVTGVLIAPEGSLTGKRVELLTQAVHQARRIGLLAPSRPTVFGQQQIDEARSAARRLGLEISVANVEGGNYAAAFAALAAARCQALVVLADSMFLRDRKKIIEQAAEHKLPAIYEWSRQVSDGGLMSYGANEGETYKQVASYIDRIFEGTQPSDLPIWQPHRLQLTINLKTARALGLSIPQSLLLGADELIR